MKKETSTLAIAVAVLFSILLFPLIFFSSFASGAVYSAESLLKPEREEDLYRSFVDNGGADWVYGLLITGCEEGLEETIGLGEKAEDLFPKDWVDTMLYDVYHAFIKGEEYQMDLSYQKDVLRDISMEYFDENMEKELREEYGEAYDMLDESTKAELMVKAEKLYKEEIDVLVEENISALEEEFTEKFNSVYDMEEFHELKELEAESGFSLTDRTELCYYLNLGGYIVLGFTGALIVILLLCHLFRSSGFITAGIFLLIDSGIMWAMAKVLPNVSGRLVYDELAVEMAAEELPTFSVGLISDLMGWCMEGFEKVGRLGLMVGLILALVGILLFVIRKNKTEAEPMTGMQ